MSKAAYVWEARDQEPTPGAQFTFAPANVGPQWIEVEATLPDGRRVFASANFNATTPTNLPPNSYQSAPLARDPEMVALYHLDTNWNNACNQNYKLSHTGNAALDKGNLGWQKHRAGAALRTCDLGDQATVSIPNDAIYSADTRGISIEAMIYITGFKGYNRGNAEILALQQDWNASLEFCENIYEGPKFRGGTQLNAAGNTLTDALTRNAWHHLGISIDKTGYTVKVDGRAVVTQPANELANWGHPGGTTTLTLGNFDGWIDEVVIRNRRASMAAR